MAEQVFAPDETWAPAATSSAAECCKDYRNLKTVERNQMLQVRQCQICNRRHFRAFALQPAMVRVTGTDTNGD